MNAPINYAESVNSGVNYYLSSIVSRYYVNNFSTDLVKSFPILRPRGSAMMESDKFTTGEVCFTSIITRFSPGFVEIKPRTNGNCATAPAPQSFATDTCTIISNITKYYGLNVVNSAKDSNRCLNGIFAENAYMAKLVHRLPFIVADLHRLVLIEFFNGLYSDYRTNDETGATVIKSWNTMSSFPGGKVVGLPTVGLTSDVLMEINAELMNGEHETAVANYVMFVGSAEYRKMVSALIKSNYNAYNVALGKYNFRTNLTFLPSYIEGTTGAWIVCIPDKYLRYDPVTKRLIFPVVNMDNYFVTPGHNLSLQSENVRGVGKDLCDRLTINVEGLLISYRASNGDIQYKDGCWESFETSLMAVRSNTVDTVFYMLASDQTADSVLAKRRVLPVNKTIAAGDIYNIVAPVIA